ncbi:helix-turn-helix domain-containing protein [Schaedlerella arabinosiphila]|jgi:DNA-binding XRE family transcriptional regulator|uniref:Helix-turn-helix domain-containing protein n=1 Tax=Schaedlerella arabinosiphila TaxID=2044587 RepID=A0A3R8JPI8_9FIRM|nr:helix-turn-helix domain-containing protein [Schaedlerella arabinosiphila]RRK33388.1 helix-turn-helix domain-containing protein [Schaedlerella arabinosiphila]
MTYAYQEIYLSKAQSVLGDVFDYAVNICGISGNDFVKLFIVSSVRKRMENGEPSCLAGKSGIEIVREIVEETKGQKLQIKPKDRFKRSREYRIGWAASYYQWYSGRKYHDIFKAISFEDLQKMYYTLHEADITKFVDIVDSKIKEHFPETNLKRIRTAYGFTQVELAECSGVSLRSIQMYEQRNKNINKASVDTVYSLAKVFGCTMEDLIKIYVSVSKGSHSNR